MSQKPLHIAFDAKRAFFNRSGLGNYSRDLVRVLSEYAPDNHYYLFKHKDKPGMSFKTGDNVSLVLPRRPFYQKFPSLWRSAGISQEIGHYPIDIYHGLSHELPLGIEKSAVKTVVTMHDCIFLRYPELFDASFRFIFKRKYAHACRVADRIIAISEQSKQDLMTYFSVDESKIDVVYQGCNATFYNAVSAEVKEQVRKKYNLPQDFLLSVGTIEERKNLMAVVRAMVKGEIDMPLVALGRETSYTAQVKAYVAEHSLPVTFIHNGDFGDFPAVYQMATIFVYPSLFEGFGIPILEAMNSGVPVITTQGGVFPEVSGEAALYVRYGDDEGMVTALRELLDSSTRREELAAQGKQRVLMFREKEIVANLMAVYQKVMKG